MTTNSYTVDFDRRDEAEMFLQHEKDLLQEGGYEFLDSTIEYSEELDRWLVRIVYGSPEPETQPEVPSGVQYAKYGEAA